MVVVVGIAWYISRYHYQLLLITGDSMEPNYHNGQLVILDKQTEEYRYGDVIAFRCKELEAVLVKRIVACPGDIVYIKDRNLIVNGHKSIVFPQKELFEYEGRAKSEIKLQREEYFVMGDNMSKSKDSRFEEVSNVKEADILGKVLQRNE